MSILAALIGILSLSMAAMHCVLMICQIISLSTGCLGLTIHVAYLKISQDITPFDITERLWLGAVCGALPRSQKRIIPQANCRCLQSELSSITGTGFFLST